MDDLTAALATDLDGAFEALVRDHQDLAFGVALRVLANAADAEEAAQDAFVRAYRALAGYDPERIRELSLRGWLVTIVVNVCRNRLRRRTPARTSLESATAAGHEPVDDRPGPAERAERRETGQYWAALVAGLPERYREVVVLRHVEGLSYEELASVLGRPEGTLKAQAHRGLALLRAAHDASLRTPAPPAPRTAPLRAARAPAIPPPAMALPAAATALPAPATALPAPATAVPPPTRPASGTPLEAAPVLAADPQEVPS
jgi:RNA polymerase sigma-70 factor (ECF subfamily)